MKKLFTLILISFLCLSVFAQKQIIPEKSFYRNEDGRLYANKDLPVYIYISSSKEEGATKYRLFSETTTKYSNPFYFDTEGINTVRTPSAVDTSTRETVYPLQDVIFEVYADDKSPTSKILFEEEKPFLKDNVYWFNSNGKINFT